MNRIRATVRLQMHRGFGFADATAQVPYFADLGISHYYLSPILTARAGSMHGYDIVDHGAVNPELGGEEGLRELVATLRRHRMGIIVDSVPNHMAVGGADNKAWLDLLEWGRESRYARFFDIDWDVTDPLLRHRIHAPFLGKPYGEALADGEVKLVFDSATGRFRFEYFEHHFPLAPRSYPLLMRLVGEPLTAFQQRFRDALTSPRARRGDAFTQACEALAEAARRDSGVGAALAALLAQFDGREPDGFGRLHHMLERQHYRLAWWRTASDEINWRRFFDVINLAGVRIQETPAFEIAHATLFRLYAEGLIDGLRIDHVDGLADPRGYCRRLRSRLNKLVRERPPGLNDETPYIIVEKILAPGERLAPDWLVDGTTGYAFMNEVGALLHEPAGEEPLTQLWAQLSKRQGDFDAEERLARRRIPQQLLAADFNACAHALHAVARLRPETRDWTLFAIRRILAELLVHFPVYRTYADARGRSAADEAIMAQTVANTLPHLETGDRPLLEQISKWLGGEAPLAARSSVERRARLRAIARFQQLSSPVAAKSVEDTAFYRYGVLLSRNEVGANPGQFALSPAQFHAENASRLERFPRAMLATATHDHKRGEDLRARLAVVSEIPSRWRDTVLHWRQLNAGLKTLAADKPAPDDADEYMLYQMLMAAWPPTLQLEDRAGLAALCDRLSNWLVKALREAKRHTSWLQQDEAYEYAAQQFLESLLDSERSHMFLAELFQFVQEIAPAGAANSLTQIALRLTSPGIPDLYQGCELWDYSLVDPDNRRPVDFAARAQLLAEPLPWEDALASWRDGRVKLQLLARLLDVRRRHAELFARGSYRSLAANGGGAERVFAFLRELGDEAVLVIATLRPAGWVAADRPAVAPQQWADTALAAALPPRSQWRCALRALDRQSEADGSVPLAQWLAGATVAVYERLI